MPSLRVPSGVELTMAGLFRQVAYLTAEDMNFIQSAAHAKPYRQPVGELLGKAFAGQYNQRRREVTGQGADFWKLQRGNFRPRFIATAVEARIHGIDTEMLILRAERLAVDKGLGCYPTPNLVCGSYVFGEVLNGWTAADDEPAPEDSVDDVEAATTCDESWAWEPGLTWDHELGKFVRDGDSD